MFTEQYGVVPEALDMSFRERLTAAATETQYALVENNLATQGILTVLARAGHGRNWRGFTNIMSGIVDAEVHPYPEHPLQLTTTVIEFDSQSRRDTFHTFYEMVLSGIEGDDTIRPQLRPDGALKLVARNLCYADIATAGRIGTIVLNHEFGRLLEQNSRLVLANKIEDIEQSGVLPFLPLDLAHWIRRIRAEWGEKANWILPSSGLLSLVGRPMRKALAEALGPEVILEAQRPKGYRPKVEDKAVFRFLRTYADPDEVPISGITLTQRVTDQFQETISDLPFMTRQPGQRALGIWELLEELGLKEGALATGRALGTVSAATVTALWGRQVDRRLKKQIKNK